MNEGYPIEIFQTADGYVRLEVQLQDETVWLSQKLMAELFQKDVRTINEHVKNIYSEGELEKASTIRKFRMVQTEGKRQVTRQVDCYNLDVIISVGYRVKSQRGVQFRQWATQTLKQHLIQGHTLNHKRLTQLGADVDSLMELMHQTLTSNNLVQPEGAAIAALIRNYARTWQLLLAYDERSLAEPQGQPHDPVLDVQAARYAIVQLKENLVKNQQASDLFGRERDKALDGILGNLHQTFDGQLLYPTPQSRAAHLFYFIIKDHPFADGNKRIGSFLFLLYLQSHGLDRNAQGRPCFADNALVALALLLAQSDPGQKDLMIRLIHHLIGDHV